MTHTKKNSTKHRVTQRRGRAIMLAPTGAQYRLIQEAAGLAERAVATYALRAAVQAARVDITARVEAAQVQLVADALRRRGLTEQVAQQEEASHDASIAHGP